MKQMKSGPQGLTFENLTVSYGDRAVLKEISGSAGPGRLVALIGPNGSGKSTLLRALGGLLPYAGSISLGGREIRNTPRAELGRDIGILPQRTALDTSLAVYDLIALGRLPHERLFTPHTSESEKSVLNAARLMGLEDLLFKSASRISGGEAQRSLLAMLLVQDPYVFLLDEPSSATDAKHSLAIFSLFREISRKSERIVLAAVHDINLAVRFADDIWALKDGRLLAARSAAGVDGCLLGSLFDIRFEKFASPEGTHVWHAAEGAG